MFSVPRGSLAGSNGRRRIVVMDGDTISPHSIHAQPDPQPNPGFPSIPEPSTEPGSLLRTLNAVKQAVEVLLGVRGDPLRRAVTVGEEVAGHALPAPLPVFVLGRLPHAPSYPNNLIFVLDGASNKHVVVSDGTVWRYMDGTSI